MRTEVPLMEDAPLDEITIRRYLLGQLYASPELVEKLDDRLFSDSSFSERVGVIEDEIIEEYLDGTLNPSDLRAVEKHFLRPPERRQKLRLLRRLNEQSDVEERVKRSLWRSHWRTLIEVAAGLVLATGSTLFFLSMRQGFQAQIAKNQRDIAQEQEHSAQVEQQIGELRNVREPSTMLLSLLQPGRVRTGISLPEVKIGPLTRQLLMEIRLQAESAGPYEVRLAPADTADKKEIWSQNEIYPLKSNLLIFFLPTNGIKPGKYEMRIRQHPGSIDEVFYSFEVTPAQ